MELAQKIKDLPENPGVYIFKDEKGRFLYVGKARSLKKRVRSYLSSSSPKIERLLKKATHLDYILTDSEIEALLLECNLIKEYRPRYNVLLRDDKKYPYIKVTLGEEFPRIFLTRDIRSNGSRLFGPYTNAKAARATLRLIRKIFPFKTCKKTKIDGKPCLNFYIGKCLGPCRGNISRQEYMEVVNQAMAFLEGKTQDLLTQLRKKMETLSKNLQFEEAARVRDQIKSIEKITFKQALSTLEKVNRDIIAIAWDKSSALATLLKIREGKLIGEEHFPLKGTRLTPPPEIIESFLLQYYSRTSSYPQEILLEEMPPDPQLLERWLKELAKKKVHLRTPQRGELKQLLRMASTNARYKLMEMKLEKRKKERDTLLSLQRELNLPILPYRIEGFDISQVCGKEAVGSMVVFEKGVPLKEEYRRFRIKAVQGIDDYGMMEEVIRRRIRRLMEEGKMLPDLILVDGGRGQVNVAKKVLHQFQLRKIPVVGLAKGEERIYLSYRNLPLLLPSHSPALNLLRRIRDEAHRFAHSYHLRLRKKESYQTLWDELPGVGEKLKEILQKKFPTLKALQQASVEELMSLPGIGRKKAIKIKEFLREKLP